MSTWLRLHIGGQVWRVVLVGPRSKLLVDYKEERVAGRTWVDKCLIAISRELSPEAREDTLLHELLHATFYVCGAFGAIQRVTAAPAVVDEDAAQRVEDDIVHPLVPVWHRLIKDLGFSFPKGPTE